MPRDRKGQAPQVPNAQAYGMRNELMEAQKQMPIPDRSGLPEPQGSAPQPNPPQAPVDMWGQLIQQMEGMQRPMRSQGLRGPTRRPNEPLTTGLRGGPGQGPEALARFRRPVAQRQATQVLQRVAQITGNPIYAALADKTRR